MSYCRISSKSDVYVWPSIKGPIVITVAWKNGKFPYGINISAQNQAEALGYLVTLKRLGVRVPEHAITRLVNEIAQQMAEEEQ